MNRLLRNIALVLIVAVATLPPSGADIVPTPGDIMIVNTSTGSGSTCDWGPAHQYYNPLPTDESFWIRYLPQGDCVYNVSYYDEGDSFQASTGFGQVGGFMYEAGATDWQFITTGVFYPDPTPPGCPAGGQTGTSTAPLYWHDWQNSYSGSGMSCWLRLGTLWGNHQNWYENPLAYVNLSMSALGVGRCYVTPVQEQSDITGTYCIVSGTTVDVPNLLSPDNWVGLRDVGPGAEVTIDLH